MPGLTLHGPPCVFGPSARLKMNKQQLSVPFSQPVHLLLINSRKQDAFQAMHRCVHQHGLTSLSEKSKVSCRKHCRSDPVRVQSTNSDGPIRTSYTAACNDNRAFFMSWEYLHRLSTKGHRVFCWGLGARAKEQRHWDQQMSHPA